MRISVLNTHQSSLAKKEESKSLESNASKGPKQTDDKRDGVFNPPKLQFQSILTRIVFGFCSHVTNKSRPYNLAMWCPWRHSLKSPRCIKMTLVSYYRSLAKRILKIKPKYSLKRQPTNKWSFGINKYILTHIIR